MQFIVVDSEKSKTSIVELPAVMSGSEITRPVPDNKVQDLFALLAAI